jgi:RNA polymerase sigma-70 factor, ECF subfamily
MVALDSMTLRLASDQDPAFVEPRSEGPRNRGIAAAIRGAAAEQAGQVVMASKFERSVEAHIPALRRYARALLRDADRAEDLLQDCLERALSRPHLFIRYDNLRGWLFRIMRSVYLNSLRAGSRMGPPLALENVNLPTVPPDQIPRVEVAETLAAFDRLPDECREAIWLVVVEGLGYRETARVLGVPPGTVMSRVARAREELRTQCQRGSNGQLRRVR